MGQVIVGPKCLRPSQHGDEVELELVDESRSEMRALECGPSCYELVP